MTIEPDTPKLHLPVGCSRRSFLSTVAISSLAATIPSGFAWAQSDDSAFWAAPRRLRLFRAQTGEGVNEVYWADGRLNEDGYLRVCHMLRDLKASQTVYMDLRLLDLVRAVQGYMEYYGFSSPFIINSGYRSAMTNAHTEGAARNSMHIHGRAVDFSMPGVPSNYMGALASHYQGGGVGFYTNAGFTHMDTGTVRYWAGGGRSPKIAGFGRSAKALGK